MTASLILIAPLLLLVIVLLFGFVGCGTVLTIPPSEEIPPDKPPDKPTGPPITPPPGLPPVTPTPYSSVIGKTAGLVTYWRLDETGGNTAVDSGPLKLNGTYQTAGVTLGQPGALSVAAGPNKAPLFDGDKGYVEVPFDPQLNAKNQIALAFTIELWLKFAPTAASSGNQVLISSRDIDTAAGKDRGYDLSVSFVGAAKVPTFKGRVYASNAATPNEITVADNQGTLEAWRHLVFGFEGNGKKLSLTVNVVGVAGAFIAPAVSGVQYQDNQSATFRIAAGHKTQPGPVGPVDGSIDEVAYYNAVLTAKDIADHFKAAQV